MENLNELLKELKTLIGGTDKTNRQRFSEILKELEMHKDEPEVQAALDQFVSTGIEEIRKDTDTLRQQVQEDEYKLLPIAYIAKHYFNKSRAWLYQRINGYSVRGKVYTLNDREKEIFNAAVQDIAKKIGSVRIA